MREFYVNIRRSDEMEHKYYVMLSTVDQDGQDGMYMPEGDAAMAEL